MAKFHIVFKYDNELPNQTQKVEKEAVALGMYMEACNKLHNRTILKAIGGSGYVRMCCGGKILREYHVQEIIADATKLQKEVKNI